MNPMPMHGGPASFIVMWTGMMAAMMLPLLAPTLWHYHRAVDGMGVPRPGWQTALVAIGYFGVWAAIGMAVFSLGVALTAAEMLRPAFARALPLTAAAVVVGGGALQFTPWKARHLAWCREASVPTGSVPAWRHGIRLGIHCSQSCIGLTAAVLVVGVMDLRAMAVATALITAERLGPAGAHVVRAIGALGVGAGLVLFARAIGVE
jgi:predicted metal-binding membrane protein